MARSTLANALASRIPVVLNLSPQDQRVTQIINSATQMLLPRGHWRGTTPRYSVSITNQIFTLPPQFATIEKIAVARWPTALRTGWYEFSPSGYGIVNDPTTAEPWINTDQVLFRGNACTFRDLSGTVGNKIKLKSDVATDNGVQVLVLGLDSNGNYIRTENPPNVWSDGELISLSQVGTLSTHTFSQITGIQKPITAGQIWLYENDGITDTLSGHYQYWETNPFYNRYLVPIIPNQATQIDLVGKLDFFPVRAPTDWLLIGNLEGLKLGCLAVRRIEENKIEEAATFLALAIAELNAEMAHYNGDGAVPTIEVTGSGFTAGCDAIPQMY